jgi:hypothetical protein
LFDLFNKKEEENKLTLLESRLDTILSEDFKKDAEFEDVKSLLGK